MKVKNQSKVENYNKVTGLLAEVARLKESNALLKEVVRKLETSNRTMIQLNKKLGNLALRDPHTGVYNRRYLRETLEKGLSLAKRYAQSFSVLMIDIDYFKSINEAYGHSFGDLVLKQFARTLRKVIRRSDNVFRLGGEEFVIVSPRTDKSRGLMFAKRLLEVIHANNFGDRIHAIKLKLSMSVVSYPEDGIVVKAIDLVTLADKILNKVKEYGGDNIYSSEDIGRMEASHFHGHEMSGEMELLKKKVDRLSQRANRSLIEVIYAVAKTAGAKDWYSDTLTKTNIDYATEIANVLKLPKYEIEQIRTAAILHDIGKVGIDETILLKRGKLTAREFSIMKKHPQLSAEIIQPLHFLQGTIPSILFHHERWDGKGYPNGLKGKQIPIGARIVGILDEYRSLTSDRPYRKAYPKNNAIRILKRESGTKFDPQVTEIFLKSLGRELN